MAELCQQYLFKGRPILVEGRLQYDEWKTKEGESRNKLRVRADIIRFLGSPQGAKEESGSEAGGAYPAPSTAASAATLPQTATAEDVPPELADDMDEPPF